MPIVFYVVVLLLTLTAGIDSPLAPRVRSSHPYIRAMIAEAQVRSVTFLGLVHAIEATDGVVYVEEGDCPAALRACFPPVLTPAGGFRFLRVLVDARQEDWQVMSDIGHELQHALEVLGDPRIRTSGGALEHLSRRDDFSSRKLVYETDEAIKAGEAIKREVKAFARSRTTKGHPRMTSNGSK